MPDTPNRNIPYVPEGTLDPAAGLNLALDVIDALLQCAVIQMDLTAPPGTPINGDLYIVAPGATGDWAGHSNDLARYVEEGDFWQFFTAGLQVVLVLNLSDGALYRFSADSPGTWVTLSSGLSAPVINTSSASTDAAATDSGNYTRFSHVAATYSFDDAEPYAIGAEFHGRYVGSGSLTLVEAGGMIIHAPAGGSLVIPPEGTFTVKIVATDEADLMGLTVASS